jgi:hypothetical protein
MDIKDKTADRVREQALTLIIRVRGCGMADDEIYLSIALLDVTKPLSRRQCSINGDVDRPGIVQVSGVEGDLRPETAKKK